MAHADILRAFVIFEGFMDSPSSYLTLCQEGKLELDPDADHKDLNDYLNGRRYCP
jgi:hypothetical protein